MPDLPFIVSTIGLRDLRHYRQRLIKIAVCNRPVMFPRHLFCMATNLCSDMTGECATQISRTACLEGSARALATAARRLA